MSFEKTGEIPAVGDRMPVKRKRRTIADATPLELSAATFVAALSQQADAERGIKTPNGTPETQARTARIVKERFFG
jgi:hypothetical protein